MIFGTINYSSLLHVSTVSQTKGGWNKDSEQHTPQICSIIGDNVRGITEC